MKIFVTGGTGFIGSHFLHAALSAGWEVLALRRSPASRPRIALPGDPRWVDRAIDEITGDDLAGCQALVHLASPGVSPQKATWEELLKWNLLDSVQLLARARAAGVPRIVVAGSCLEYGASGERYDFVPPDAPLEPKLEYAAAKAAGFTAMTAFARVNKLQFLYARLFYAYGEGQFVGNFWPALRDAALRGEDFPMTSGRQVFDVIPVERVAKYFVHACERPDLEAGAPVVENVGRGIPISLLEFATEEWSRLGARGKILVGVKSDRPGETWRLVPDVRATIWGEA